jgi:Na+-translocating ferredoxin:NAD+ oxidoreductase RnfE subunit
MNFDWMKEGIGYAASLIILVSLLMTNVFRLRVINGIGSVLFGAYGWLIGSWPVCVINLVIAGIDGWYLLQTLTSGAFFDLAPATSVGPEYLKRFFMYHERERRNTRRGIDAGELRTPAPA